MQLIFPGMSSENRSVVRQTDMSVGLSSENRSLNILNSVSYRSLDLRFVVRHVWNFKASYGILSIARSVRTPHGMGAVRASRPHPSFGRLRVLLHAEIYDIHDIDDDIHMENKSGHSAISKFNPPVQYIHLIMNDITCYKIRLSSIDAIPPSWLLSRGSSSPHPIRSS